MYSVSCSTQVSSGVWLCVCQEVEFVLAPGQELYSLKFDVLFTDNIALLYFIGETVSHDDAVLHCQL